MRFKPPSKDVLTEACLQPNRPPSGSGRVHIRHRDLVCTPQAKSARSAAVAHSRCMAVAARALHCGGGAPIAHSAAAFMAFLMALRFMAAFMAFAAIAFFMAIAFFIAIALLMAAMAVS